MGLRALAVFADRPSYLVHQTVALYESLLYSGAVDTHLVCFGPADVLARLPDGPGMVKVEQDAHPLAQRYAFINSLSCLTGPGSGVLDGYDMVLKTDVDTFVTPAWAGWQVQGVLCGQGAYVHSDEVKLRLRALAQRFGCRHEGRHNLGSTIFGPPKRVRAVAALAMRLTEHLLDVEFAQDQGAWPGWFVGVSSMYATEVALNHLEPDLLCDANLLDYPSDGPGQVAEHPHVHCWHRKVHYSKHNWIDGLYEIRPEADLDLTRVPDYCLAMAQRAASRLA